MTETPSQIVYLLTNPAMLGLFKIGKTTQSGLENSLRSALGHKAIIDRFGRYPHRNAVLGRNSTAEELAFLSKPGASF